MRLKDVIAKSTLIIKTCVEVEAARAIDKATGGQFFYHIDVIHGEDRSIRVFLPEPTGTSIPLVEQYDSSMIALIVNRHARKGMRYPAYPGGNYVKGCEIRVFRIRKKLAVLIQMQWVLPPN